MICNYDDLINIIENVNQFMIGLTVFVFIIAVIVYGLIMTVLDQNKKIQELKRDIESTDDYLEHVRKVNLKKRSDEKLILPVRFPKDKYN